MRKVGQVGDAVSQRSDAVGATGELPLLGRTRELADLETMLDEAAAGHGALVLLTGEPGIGKTRLATALGERAAAEGHRVAWARGWDGGGAPAFWPWVQIVRSVAADRDDDALRVELGAGARWVAQLAPELRERLDLPEAGDLESEQARFALFDAVTVFLRNAAARQPLVVLLDDLHTADLPSLLLLAFLARAVGETHMLVITTHHEAGPPRGPEFEAVFGELTRFGMRVDLSGLEDDDLRTLVIHRSGAHPSEELVQSLHTLTEGNPFYSDEVVRLLVAQGRIDQPLGERLPLPDGVRDAIRRRLLPLRPEVLEALKVGAVEGREFQLATLERAAGIGRADLLERLDEALAVQLLEETPGPAGSFRFVHGLIRETLYGDLTATRRARLHAAVGEALERTSASEAELAHHFVEAAAVGDPAKALEHAHRAGHEALAALAYERAADLFDAALSALDLLRRARRAAARRAAAPARPGADASGRRRRAVDAPGRHRARTARGRRRPAGPRRAQPGRVRALAGHGRRRSRGRARGGARRDSVPTAARSVRACSCAWPSPSTTPMPLSAARSWCRRRSASPATSATRRRWPTSSTRATSPPTGPTPPSAAWPGRRSSSRWPTRRATPTSPSARARGRSTCCSSSTTSPARTWRSRRWRASHRTRATRAPAPTSRCTARGGR